MVFEYIEKAWKTYTKNVWKFIGATFLLMVVTLIIFSIGFIPLFYLSYGSGTTYLLSTGLPLLIFALIMTVIAILVSAALGAGIIKMAAEALKGRTRINTMFVTARKKFWTIIGANIIVFIIVGLLFLIFLSPGLFFLGTLLTEEATSSVAVLRVLTGIFLLFILMIPAVLISLFFQFVNQSIVIDNKSALESIGHSFAVVKRCYLQLLALVIIFGIVTGIISSIPILSIIIDMFLIAPLSIIAYTALYLSKRKPKRKIKKRR